MISVKVTTNYEEVKELYYTSFPEDERIPFEDMYQKYKESELFSIYDEEQFVGFISLLSYNGYSHIMYFAIDERYQKQGYGSQTLQWLKDYKKENCILADLEDAKYGDNQKQRLQRQEFYKKNGFHQSEVAYCWQSEQYIIMECNGSVQMSDFGAFWKYFSQYKK